jgi:hypothetical protein
MKNEIENYLNFISTNFNNWYSNTDMSKELAEERMKDFKETLSFEEGSAYIKVMTKTSVHTFIVKKDGPKFKKGDILKAASWKAPAKNFARGNIFQADSYKNIQWCGA